MYLKKKFQGKSTYRFKHNPLEKILAEHWQKQNEKSGGPTLLEYTYCPKNRGRPSPPISDRDNEIAATIVQWLGSPVGQSFLRELMQDPKYKKHSGFQRQRIVTT